MHRAILIGFASYLLIFTTLLNVLRDFGFDQPAGASSDAADGYAYLFLLCGMGLRGLGPGPAAGPVPQRHAEASARDRMSWLWLTPLLALVVTWILGRYNARAIERDWEMMLTAKGRGAIEALELQVLCDGAAVESARIGAMSARERADFPQATRLAGLAYRAVEEATPDRLKRLRAMGVCIRMATAILPVAPLKPRDFRLTQLSSLAGLLEVHPSPAGQHRASASCCASTSSVSATASSPARWAARAAASATTSATCGPGTSSTAPLRTGRRLEREHVESFRVFVLSLTAEKRLESGT